MVIITLHPRTEPCTIELDGVDISRRVRQMDVETLVDPNGRRFVRMTVVDVAVIVGDGAIRLTPPEGQHQDKIGAQECH